MYENWKTKKSYSPKSIRLDSKNPRLHDVPSDPNQPDLINLLVEQYNGTMRKLAKSIVDKGFFPHEDIILVEESGKLVVVEGNCRVGACHILLNPDSVKDLREKNYFKRLASKLTDRALNSFKKIPCSVAPTREQAYVLIENRHTGVPINPWTPYAQGNFYRTLIKEGYSIQQLAEEFNRPASEIRGKLRLASVSDVIMHLPSAEKNPKEYSSDIKKIGEAAGYILRLLQSKEASDFFKLKLKMDEEGNITGDLPDEDFLGVMSSLADDALVNKDVKGNPLIDTRILNDEAGRKKYLKNYSGYFPQGHRRGKFNSKDFLGRQAGSKPDNNNKGDRTSTHKKSKLRTKPKNDQYLVNTDVDVNIKSDKVKALIEEAQTHKWETTPHTSGLLLRSIIELCLKTRIKGLNLWKEVINLNKRLFPRSSG